MSASVVVGQPNFTSNSAGTTQSRVDRPHIPFSDGQRFIVPDLGNHRVLIWNSIPTQNGQSTDLVLGQPDFTSKTANNGGVSARSLSSPTSVYYDGTHLFVADSNNRRVLIWNSLPTTNQQAADVVVGQPDFTTNSTGTTASKFNRTFGVLVYNGKLIISEDTNCRVLIYNSIPITNGASANVVIGQDDFTSTTCNAAAANRFLKGAGSSVRAMAVYNGKLLVTNGDGNRILIWNSIPTTNGTSADVVIGQPDFTSTTADNGGTSCATLSAPDGIYVDDKGRLYVGDGKRLLIFNQIPTQNFQSADIVIGQSNCTTRESNFAGLGTKGFNNNVRVGNKIGNKLFVSDTNNSRLLIFENVIDTPKAIFTSSPVQQPDGRVRFSGEVSLSGGTHSIWKIEASVNGGPFGAVTSLWDTVRTNPGIPDDKIAKFYHDIKPDNLSDYTVTFKAFSTNADTVSFTYFTPFTLDSVSPIKFSVNKTYLNLLKDQLDHYEVWVKQDIWQKHIDQIPIAYDLARDKEDNLLKILDNTLPEGGNGIYENGNLKATYTNDSATIQVSSKLTSLSPGKYEMKVLAVDKSGHSQETLPQELIIEKPYPYRVNPNKPRVQGVAITTVNSQPAPSPQAKPGPKPSPSPIQSSETERSGIFGWIVDFLEAIFR